MNSLVKFWRWPWFNAARLRPRVRVPYLEAHVAHTCNLSCQSCSHYSQHRVGGIVTLATLAQWFGDWSKRLRVEELGLLGGEPTLNPELAEILYLAHRVWPKAQITLRTNGFFIHKHPRLRAALRDTGTRMWINQHGHSPEYTRKFSAIEDHLKEWTDVDIWIRKTEDIWTRRYYGHGDSLRPFQDANPRASWEACTAKKALTLLENRLWKCPPIAYLRLLENKVRLSAEWNPYLAYQGIGLDCSNRELKEFARKEEESICHMCSSKPQPMRKTDPLLPPPPLR